MILMRLLALLVPVFVLVSSVDSSQLTVIRGRVVAQEDAAFPMRGARVELVGGSAKADPIWSDGEGRFALGVPLSYTLKISKAGFAPAIVAGKGGDAPGERLVRLSRGAVITGRVSDELGFPVVAVGVRARRVDPSPTDIGAGLIEFTAERTMPVATASGAFRQAGTPYTARRARPAAISPRC